MGRFVVVFFAVVGVFVMVCCANKPNEKKSDESLPSEYVPVQDTVELDIVTEKINRQEINVAVQKEDTLRKPFPYNISIPSQTSILSIDLMEISGLSYDNEKQLIYGVNDEKGILYSIDPADGSIINQVKFGKRGDYEGVELANNGYIYAIKSNGNMIEIEGEDKFNSIKTDLRTSNDVEGLGYYPSTNSLVIACKGYPNLEKEEPKSNKLKSIFSYSISTSTLSEEPILQIEDKDLTAFFEGLSLEMSKAKKKKYKKRLSDFSPSGIAYNTTDDLFYILSSVGKTLVTVDIHSKIHHVEFLDNTYFAQPEGICFDKDNAMYISNEGKGLVAKLMKFDRR